VAAVSLSLERASASFRANSRSFVCEQ
jgi:hypothetical protein